MSGPTEVVTIVTSVVQTTALTITTAGQTFTITSVSTSELPTPTVVVTVTSSSSVGAPSGETGSSSSSPTNKKHTGSGFGIGAIIGVAAGASALFIAVVLGIFLYRRHKHRLRKRADRRRHEAETGRNNMDEIRPYNYRPASSLTAFAAGGLSSAADDHLPGGSSRMTHTLSPGIGERGERVTSLNAGHVSHLGMPASTSSQSASQGVGHSGLGGGHRRKGLEISNTSEPGAEERAGEAASTGVFQHTDSGQPLEAHPEEDAIPAIPPSYDSLAGPNNAY